MLSSFHARSGARALARAPGMNSVGRDIIVIRHVNQVSGLLEVIATPIGNLGDLSSRALESLRAADLIAAEDTRHSGQLLRRLGLQKTLISLHSHNESRRTRELLNALSKGSRIALISDAGTPLLSDPGYELVHEAAAAGITVRSIPGPTAIAAALAVSGLPCDRFCFEGFLPAKDLERRQFLDALRAEPRSMVFFESPHRLQRAMDDMQQVFGAPRQAVVARELTKLHEQVYRGSLEQLSQQCKVDSLMSRGEITLVIAGAQVSEVEAANSMGEGTGPLLDRCLRAALMHLPASKAAAIAASVTGVSRADAYARAMTLKELIDR
jgi:16S rRNA (cytidine1402-2'-O)-methyltransferase